VLCDKIELGPPAGLKELVAGDFVALSLELMVLPRSGVDYTEALTNSNSQARSPCAGATGLVRCWG